MNSYKKEVLSNLYTPDPKLSTSNFTMNNFGRTKITDDIITYKSLIEYNCNLEEREGIINVIVKRENTRDSETKSNPEVYYPKNSFTHNLFDSYNSKIILIN